MGAQSFEPMEIYSLLVLGFCPLTKLEEKLRSKVDPDFSYNNSFTTVYFNKIFKTNITARNINIGIIILHAASYAIAVLICPGSHT